MEVNFFDCYGFLKIINTCYTQAREKRAEDPLRRVQRRPKPRLLKLTRERFPSMINQSLLFLPTLVKYVCIRTTERCLAKEKFFDRVGLLQNLLHFIGSQVPQAGVVFVYYFVT